MAKCKNFEIVQKLSLLKEEDIIKAINIVDETGKNHLLRYAYILHDKDKKKDGTPIEPHWHILISMDNSYEFQYIAKRFGVPENMVNKIKARFSNALCYLTHNTEQAKKDNKFQYEDDEVKSNYNWKGEAQQAIDIENTEHRRKEIIEMIADGKIKRYNKSDYISISEYDKFNKSIEYAFKYREEILARNTSRNMHCIFIQGDSGFGKTSFAKVWCKKQGLDFFCSSGSNDPLDNYAGQPVIILDDLRPSTYNLSDLLKLLDNNTASTVKSRYRNKVLETEYIIITTTLDINKFFSNVFSEEKETIVQLKRRCEIYMRVHKDNVDIYRYNKSSRDYDFISKIENPIPKVIETQSHTSEEKETIIEKFSLTEDDVKSFLL